MAGGELLPTSPTSSRWRRLRRTGALPKATYERTTLANLWLDSWVRDGLPPDVASNAIPASRDRGLAISVICYVSWFAPYASAH